MCVWGWGGVGVGRGEGGEAFRKFEKWAVNLQCFTGERKSEMQFPFFCAKAWSIKDGFYGQKNFFFEGTKWDNIPSKMYCTCSLSFSSLVIKRCLILFSVCRIIFICELSAFVSIVHDIVMRVSKYCSIIIIIIPSKFFFLFIGREPRLFSVDFLTE